MYAFSEEVFKLWHDQFLKMMENYNIPKMMVYVQTEIVSVSLSTWIESSSRRTLIVFNKIQLHKIISKHKYLSTCNYGIFYLF